ncbi:MAG: RNA polymerase sigma factor (sigma-70 family) [Candidatus Paceibacteria bacterium]|jgi:RNA polymerase sigma factor (sigma-70 family)
MNDRKLDRLFDRFRKKGDTGALARVFDATASELLGVAVHLVREVGEAEDLLQETFLTAIEKADRYDADRRLVPWLVGILVRHAHNARRRGSRTENAPLPELSAGETPAGSAEHNELTDSISKALSGLPETYRKVLEPYLLRGERAVDIARASGTAPGTVRVQLRRGLDELRRILPAGLTLGTGLLVGGRSLGGVREVVLEEAKRWAQGRMPLGAASVSSTTLLGGLAMSNKLMLAAVALTLVSVLGWVSQWDPLTGIEGLETSRLTSNSALAGDATPSHLTAPSAGTERVREPKTASPKTAGKQPASSAYEARLAGAFGRIVDENGTPIADLPVELFQVSADLFVSNLAAPFQSSFDRGMQALEQNPVVATTKTDDEGHFEFSAALPGNSHALGIDVGGARPSLRILESSLKSGHDTDLGTIRMAAVRSLRGQVLDPNGTPVAGARVRALNLPESLRAFASLRNGSSLLISPGGLPDCVIRPTPAVMAVIDHLPIPTTLTDSEGNFELFGPVAGDLQLYVNHAQHGLAIVSVQGVSTEQTSIRFPLPAPFHGQVLDSEGTPVAGAQVLFGATDDPTDRNPFAVAQGEVLTDSSGRFDFECNGPPMVFVRRNENTPWVTAKPFENGQEIKIAAEWNIRVALTDHAGNPISGAALFLEAQTFLPKMGAIVGVEPGLGTIKELGEGQYEVQRLTPGHFTLRALADGFALFSDVLETTTDAEEFSFELDRCAARQVRVLDASTRAPIERAKVSIQTSGRRGQRLTSGISDSAGSLALTKVPVEGETKLTLAITHPGYASLKLDFNPRLEEPQDVLMSSANEAMFRILAENSAPNESLLVTIEPGIGNDFVSFPSFLLSDTSGNALFEHLQAGNWGYSVSARFLQEDAFGLLNMQKAPTPYAKGKFTVREGQRTIVDVDIAGDLLESSVAADTCGVEGRVSIRNARKLNLQIGIVDEESWESKYEMTPLSTDGSYRFDDMAPGNYRLLVVHVDPTGGTSGLVADCPFRALEDRMVRRDVILEGTSFSIQIQDDSGRPVTDARIFAHSMESETNQAGIPTVLKPGLVEVTVWGTGKFYVRIDSPTAGIFQETITVSGEPDERFEVTLDLGVPCAGTVSVPDASFTGAAHLTANRTSSSVGPVFSANVPIELIDGSAQFNLVGLQAGSYTGYVDLLNGQPSHLSVSFKLSAGGDSALVLKAAQQDDSSPSPTRADDKPTTHANSPN